MLNLITAKFVNKDPNWRLMVRVEQNIESSTAEGVDAAANALVSDIRSNWSPSAPSQVGTAPAIVTGNLDSSIKVDDQKRDRSGRFSKDAIVKFVRMDTSTGDNPNGRGNYGAVLEENLDRPFIQPAIDRMQGQYESILKRYVKP